jgi:Tol biopolymer transport system component
MSVATDGTEGDLDSTDAAISADGSTVAFVSASRKLVDPPTDGRSHVFVHERGAQTTTLVTQLSNGTFADGDSFHPALSVDGDLVAFFTNARNLVPLDTNGATDVPSPSSTAAFWARSAPTASAAGTGEPAPR